MGSDDSALAARLLLELPPSAGRRALDETLPASSSPPPAVARRHLAILLSSFRHLCLDDWQGAEARRNHKLGAIAATTGLSSLHEACKTPIDFSNLPTLLYKDASLNFPHVPSCEGPSDQISRLLTCRWQHSDVPSLWPFDKLGLLIGKLQLRILIQQSRRCVPVVRSKRLRQPTNQWAVCFSGWNSWHKLAAKKLLQGGSPEHCTHQLQRAEPRQWVLNLSTELSC
ncbi:uncharacterized protein LOC8079888 [Sorghum bicolor]|uniref:uncharacterized protein LOC8079888 n=1 Tax=Sorghum bicolor TaxID=4558 RepID=UPI000B426525|nr:uncharacterized protein LOC8079888 [Sorghum bicolor]|eukprot:XP_002442901.2 uncharacterized protein LOC8079888 [Sorghum bicolor]